MLIPHKIALFYFEDSGRRFFRNVDKQVVGRHIYIFFEDLLTRIISRPESKWCSHLTSSCFRHVVITMYGKLKISWSDSQWHTFRKKFCEKIRSPS